MEERQEVHPSRQIRFFSSFEEAENADIDYWNSKSFEEKMRATKEITEYFYRQRGEYGTATRPARSLVRVQCPWG